MASSHFAGWVRETSKMEIDQVHPSARCTICGEANSDLFAQPMLQHIDTGVVLKCCGETLMCEAEVRRHFVVFDHIEHVPMPIPYHSVTVVHEGCEADAGWLAYLEIREQDESDEVYVTFDDRDWEHADEAEWY